MLAVFNTRSVTKDYPHCPVQQLTQTSVTLVKRSTRGRHGHTSHILLKPLKKNAIQLISRDCPSGPTREATTAMGSTEWQEWPEERLHSEGIQRLTHMRLGEHDRPQRLDSGEGNLTHDLRQAAGIPSHCCHLQGRAGLHHHRQHPHHQAHKLQVTGLAC